MMQVKPVLISMMMIALPALAVEAAAQQPQQPRQACLGDIRKLCSSSIGDRDAMRACMRDKRDQLSPGCRDALKARFEAQNRDAPAPAQPAE